MISHPNLDQLNPGELRALAAQLIRRVETMDKQITHHKSVNEKLAHEIALLKRFKFAKRSEQLSPDQASLLDDLINTNIAAIEAELEALQPTAVEAKLRQQPKRAALPAQFPRMLIHHEPDNSHCGSGLCKREYPGRRFGYRLGHDCNGYDRRNAGTRAWNRSWQAC